MKNGVESRMDVISLCPLRVASMLWQPAPGAWTLTVVCKATYRLAPEVSLLHPEQDDPNEEDSHWDDDLRRSLSSPSDLVPFKARADVLLVGNAYSPGKQVVARLVARMIVGEVDKSIEVFGKRAWTRDGTLQEGPGFSSLPLVYERAAGGPETWNPVGVRPDAAPDAQGSVALPNLQPPGVTVARRGDVVPPIGFGPIAPAWALRAELLGRHRGALSMAAWRDRPLPEDLSPAYFNAAPRDQQVEAIRGDERVVLEHLHRQHARLVTRLPGIRPRAFAERSGALPLELGMRCDTVWIDTDRGICALTWRGHVPLERPEQEGRVLVGMEERGQRVGWEEVARLAGGARGEVGRAEEVGERTAQLAVGTETARLSPELVAKAVLPFLEQAGEGARPSTQGAGDAGLPFVRSGGVAGEVASAKVMPPELLGMAIAPPALVRPAMAGEAGAPTLGVSPWAGGAVPSPSTPLPGITTEAANPPRPQANGRGGSGIMAAGNAVTSSESQPKSLLAASNAAAARESLAAPDEARKAPASGVASPARVSPAEAVELIWFDTKALPRVRKHPAWKKLLAGVKDPKPRMREEDWDEDLREKRQEAKDRRDIAAILRRGEAVDAAGIEAAMAGAMEEETFAPPLVLVAGELELLFDEIEVLKATMVAVAPFVPVDKKLKEAVDVVGEVMKTPGLERARGVVERLIGQVRDAFGQAGRGVPAGYLEAQTEAMLLEGRCYQKRAVLGGEWLRGALWVAGAREEAVPAYLPEGLRNEVPMFRRFRVRVVAEARRRVDQQEGGKVALKVMAVGSCVGT